MATGAELVAELKYRRNDVGGVKHDHARYLEIVNRAIRECPGWLWPPSVDVSKSTIADTRRYALATITGLTEPDQVRRIWMDDADTFDKPIGRWEVEDDEGTLTLVLDEDPPEAGRVLTIEFLKPYTELANEAATTTLDREWLCARAMTLLLLEADPQLEDMGYITAQVTYWDQARQGRERELMGQYRPPARKIRSGAW